jgi:hypothetical protein
MEQKCSVYVSAAMFLVETKPEAPAVWNMSVINNQGLLHARKHFSRWLIVFTIQIHKNHSSKTMHCGSSGLMAWQRAAFKFI